MSIKKRVRILYPGSFFPESSSRAVDDFDPNLIDDDGKMYGFQFYEIEEIRGETGILIGEPKYDKKTYLIGRAYTLDELKKLFPEDEHRIGIQNVELNGWKGAVVCRPGNWQPWSDDVVVIDRLLR